MRAGCSAKDSEPWPSFLFGYKWEEPVHSVIPERCQKSLPLLSLPHTVLWPTNRAPSLPREAVLKEATWSNGSRQVHKTPRASTISVNLTEAWQADMATVTRLKGPGGYVSVELVHREWEKARDRNTERKTETQREPERRGCPCWALSLMEAGHQGSHDCGERLEAEDLKVWIPYRCSG